MTSLNSISHCHGTKSTFNCSSKRLCLLRNGVLVKNIAQRIENRTGFRYFVSSASRYLTLKAFNCSIQHSYLRSADKDKDRVRFLSCNRSNYFVLEPLALKNQRLRRNSAHLPISIGKALNYLPKELFQIISLKNRKGRAEDNEEVEDSKNRKKKEDKNQKNEGDGAKCERGGVLHAQDFRILRVLAGYLWSEDNPEFRCRILLSWGLLVAAKVLNVQVPFLFKLAVDRLSSSSTFTISNWMLAPICATPVAIIIGYGLARVGAYAFNELRVVVFSKVTSQIVRIIARKVFSHLHDLDLQFHVCRETGALSIAIDRGIRAIHYILGSMVFNVLPTILEILLVGTILANRFGYPFVIVSTLATVAYSLFTIIMTQWWTKFHQAMIKAERNSRSVAIDSLINYETVKYFNNEQFEINKYDKLLKEYESSYLKTMSSLAFLNFGQNVLFSSALSTVMVMCLHGIAKGMMTVGDLVMVNSLLFQLSTPLTFLSSVYREICQGLIDMQTLFSLLEEKSTIKDKPNAKPLYLNFGGGIQFENVHFSYDGRKILDGVSFIVPGGKSVAIVGNSGSGKSTILKLLYRFYDSEVGRISVDGQDIKDVTFESLRRCIGLVPQDPVLFNDTIFYNILYGRLTASKEEVFNVAKHAAIHDIIMKYPDKYKTLVGERGLKLSGGEKQRLALARAFLKSPFILLCDEATSALDNTIESKILSTLKDIAKNRTCIFIAHCLTTAMLCDEIIVMDNGKVIEQGTHEHLLFRRGRYFQLWEQQQISKLNGQDQLVLVNGQHQANC